MKLLKTLIAQKLISPPHWLVDNLLYANIHGSELYGCATDTSDKDIYGICMPPLTTLFPHLLGWVNGFGSPPSFNQWVEHHVEYGKKTYDFNITSLPQFLWLAKDGNPNIIECLFAPHDCVLHSIVAIGPLLDYKSELLTKKCVPRFMGYAVSQLRKLQYKTPQGKRKQRVDEHGYDTKFASHCIRLLTFCEQILTSRYIDLRRDRELLKSIKRGEWKLPQIEEWVQNKIIHLDKLNAESSLPEHPNSQKIYDIMLGLIECHYGSVSNYLKTSRTDSEVKLDKIREILG